MAKNLTSESLNRLLAEFSEDERQAAAYTTLRGSLVRFFEIKGDSEPETAADETLDRTALKAAADTPIDDIKKYSFGVARLIFLERLRLSQKEKKPPKISIREKKFCRLMLKLTISDFSANVSIDCRTPSELSCKAILPTRRLKK